MSDPGCVEAGVPPAEISGFPFAADSRRAAPAILSLSLRPTRPPLHQTIGDFMNDVRFALRQLFKSPALAIVDPLIALGQL
jgi:hypothetical protein